MMKGDEKIELFFYLYYDQNKIVFLQSSFFKKIWSHKSSQKGLILVLFGCFGPTLWGHIF